MKTAHNSFKNRLARIQLLIKLFLGLIIAASPSGLLAQEMTQNTVSNGAGLVSGGNYTGYVSAGQMATYMYANGTQMSTQGIILNEISGDVEFTFELSGTLTENETLKSGALRMKSAAAVAAGPPLAFVNVFLIDEETGLVLFETITDENGYFEFLSIPYKNYYFTINEPVIPTEPVLLSFESNIFIKEVEINGEVGTEGITAEVVVKPATTCDPESEDYQIWYLDYDGDGFGTNTFSVGQCTQPNGYVLNDIDCDDNNAEINPDAVDIDGIPIDFNCDGEIPCNSFELLEFDILIEPTIHTDVVPISAYFTGDLPSTAEWNWGDGTSSAGEISEGIVTGTHSYADAGVYVINLTVTDGCEEIKTFSYKYKVIYDPSSGFVTGSGTIFSPLGASTLFPNATGLANFGFVSKYDKKKLVPKGNTEFEFNAGDLKFVSTEYEWLIVAGSKAKFKGKGSINGISGYQFMISTIDGDIKEKGDPDFFRIKIWSESSGGVVYDNEMEMEIDADPSTEILKGSIKIHTPKTKSESILTSADIDDFNLQQITVFPNPTTGKVFMEIENVQSMDYTVSVINMLGQKILEQTSITQNRIELNLTGNTPGVYFIKLFDGETQMTEKIVLRNK